MDLQSIRKYFVLTTIFSSLMVAIVVTTIISRYTPWIITSWIIYSFMIAIAFTILKLWNRSLQEPIMDVNLNHLEMIISVSLAVLVALFGGALMHLEVIKNSSMYSFLLLFVMTLSQFNLLKSVQPDPASPTHGFNRVISLSRPIYFNLLATLILICEFYTKSPTIRDQPDQRPSLVFYGFDIFDRAVVGTVGIVSLILIVHFPIIFLLGLLPQINTFIIYVLEQIDMHLFGSTASTLGLKSVIYSFLRSLFAVLILYLIALQSVGTQKSELFSLFCGLLVALAYFLSRNSSDTTIASRIFKRCLRALNTPKQPRGSERIELDDIVPPQQNQLSPQPPPQTPPQPPQLQPQPLLQPPPSHSHQPVEVMASQRADSPPIDPEFFNYNTKEPALVTTTSAESTSTEGDVDSTSAINSQDTTLASPLTSNVNTNNNHNINEETNHNTNVANTTTNDSNNSNTGATTVTINDNNNNNNNLNNESNSNTLEREEKDSDRGSISTRIQANIDDICITRLKKDLFRCLKMTILVFALHVTGAFHIHHDLIEKTFGILAIIWGILFHYVIPQLRRDIPCMCLAKPVLKPREYNFFEVKTSAKIMWFEKVHEYALAFERDFIYPIFWLNIITHDSMAIKELYGQHIGPLILVIISLKLVRSSFNDASPNYLTIVFTYLFFNYDIGQHNHRIFTLNYFVITILHLKLHELLLKLQFIYIYIAPWQIPWGSAFHAFAQPFSVPHSALLFCQAILSSILSAPLQPILGSAIFMMSYVRPVKFWERDYNTNVIDINSTRLVTQLERNRIDSNRLDGVFYEHLTKCLQRKLCKDLSLGRWGPVSQGDCFIMASDNLNCLIHIIELGNGVCTFQLRGLEFRGTYCQQQEVEAITEGVPQDDGFCCCEPGHLPYFLSANAAFNQLWLAWHVTHTRYVLEGYSISDNPAGPMLQPPDLRQALITYYVKAIIYFTITSPQLSRWLRTNDFHEALKHTKDKMYADLDPTFSHSLDLDYDERLCGVTRTQFCSIYFNWINYCVERVKKDKTDAQRAKAIAEIDCNSDSFLVSLCYGLSLLARRSLSAAADGQQFHTVESLLYGLHALLKGDFRITSLHDEWIFQEIRFFKLVVIPAVRMSLKLHQDHFAAPDDYDENIVLYEAIAGYQKNLIIAHETDIAWREGVLKGWPSLLTLRLYTDDGSNQYKFIMLNRRYVSFRIIKINRECVRGLWASQQQELVFMRNSDPERGSIQNCRQALRNMINSACDPPIGYPIYVSPLTTSYLECSTMSSFMKL